MITMQIEGANLATNAFINIVSGVNEKKELIKKVMIPAAKIVKKAMIAKAPILKGGSFDIYRGGKIYVSIKPGQLKKSISYFHTPSTRKAGAINVGPRYKKGVWKKPDKGGWFMHMVQFGTAFVKPQPFVLPALQETESVVGAMLVSGMNKRLKTVVRKDGAGVIEMK